MTVKRLPRAQSVTSEAGFTLVEVLVAFVIFAGALGVLLQVMSDGLRQGRTADDHATATLLAESRLAAVGIAEPLVAGDSSGRFDERFRWSLSTRPYVEAGRDFLGSPLRPFRVAVTVSWGDGDEERRVSLATLRLSAVDERDGNR